MTVGAADLVAIDRAASAIVADPAGRIRATVTIRVAGTPCAVHFDDDAVAERFAAKYADLACAERAVNNAFALRDPVLGPLFWSDGGPVMRWPRGDLDAATTAFFADAAALTAFFHERSDGIVSFHAAAVGAAGVAAAIVGDTNVGKTTTTLACGRIGLHLYSDERCVVDRNAVVHAFPRAVTVRSDGGARLLRDAGGSDGLAARLRARGPDAWSDVRFAELFPTWSQPASAPLRAIFVLSGVAAQPSLTPVPRSTAVRAAARFAHGAGTGLDRLALLHERFRGVACYRLILGSPDASAHAVRTAIEHAALERSA